MISNVTQKVLYFFDLFPLTFLFSKRFSVKNPLECYFINKYRGKIYVVIGGWVYLNFIDHSGGGVAHSIEMSVHLRKWE